MPLDVEKAATSAGSSEVAGAPADATWIPQFNESGLDSDDEDSVPFWLGSTRDTAAAKYVTLDAMIPREDFGREVTGEYSTELIRDFPISNLENESPIRKQLRKPDFQRETNHWTPDQVVTLIASLLIKK